MHRMKALLLTGTVIFSSCVFAQGGRVSFAGKVVHPTCSMLEKAEGFIDAECNDRQVQDRQGRALNTVGQASASSYFVKITVTAVMRGDTPVGRVVFANYY